MTKDRNQDHDLPRDPRAVDHQGHGPAGPEGPDSTAGTTPTAAVRNVPTGPEVAGATSVEADDPLVAAALRQLPVPDHQHGFWDRLDRAVAAEPAPASAELAPAPVAAEPAGAPVDLSSRRHPTHRRRVWLAAAAVVAVAAAVGVIVVGAERGGDEVATDPVGTTTSVPSTDTQVTPTTGSTTTSTSTQMSIPERIGDGTEAVRSFFERIGQSDRDGARALLGPQSLAYIAGMSDGGESMLRASEEGWGSWHFSPDLQMRAVEVDEDRSVVVLEGSRDVEGTNEWRVDAIPVRWVDGRWTVELWAFGPGETTPIPTAPGFLDDFSSMDPDAGVSFSVMAGGRTQIILDGVAHHFDDPTLTTAVYVPPAPLSPGTHRVVVASVGPDWFTAIAGDFIATP